MTPRMSSGRGTVSRTSGTNRGAPHAIKAQAGKLMRKIQRQPSHDETRPPMVGPRDMAIPDMTPNQANARVRACACV